MSYDVYKLFTLFAGLVCLFIIFIVYCIGELVGMVDLFIVLGYVLGLISAVYLRRKFLVKFYNSSSD